MADWSPELDAQLATLVEDLCFDWDAIAAAMPTPLSGDDVRLRWAALSGAPADDDLDLDLGDDLDDLLEIAEDVAAADGEMTGLEYLEYHEAQQAALGQQRRVEREAMFGRVLESLGGPDSDPTRVAPIPAPSAHSQTAYVDSGLHITLPPAPPTTADDHLSHRVSESQLADREAHRAALAAQREAMLQTIRAPVRLDFLDGASSEEDGDEEYVPQTELGDILNFLKAEREKRKASPMAGAGEGGSASTPKAAPVAASVPPAARVEPPKPAPPAAAPAAPSPAPSHPIVVPPPQPPDALPRVLATSEEARKFKEQLTAPHHPATAPVSPTPRAYTRDSRMGSRFAADDAGADASGEDSPSSDEDDWRAARSTLKTTGRRARDILVKSGVEVEPRHVQVAASLGSPPAARPLGASGGNAADDGDDLSDGDEVRKQWEWQAAQDAKHEAAMVAVLAEKEKAKAAAQAEVDALLASYEPLFEFNEDALKSLTSGEVFEPPPAEPLAGGTVEVAPPPTPPRGPTPPPAKRSDEAPVRRGVTSGVEEYKSEPSGGGGRPAPAPAPTSAPRTPRGGDAPTPAVSNAAARRQVLERLATASKGLALVDPVVSFQAPLPGLPPTLPAPASYAIACVFRDTMSPAAFGAVVVWLVAAGGRPFDVTAATLTTHLGVGADPHGAPDDAHPIVALFLLDGSRHEGAATRLHAAECLRKHRLADVLPAGGAPEWAPASASLYDVVSLLPDKPSADTESGVASHLASYFDRPKAVYVAPSAANVDTGFTNSKGALPSKAQDVTVGVVLPHVTSDVAALGAVFARLAADALLPVGMQLAYPSPVAARNAKASYTPTAAGERTLVLALRGPDAVTVLSRAVGPAEHATAARSAPQSLRATLGPLGAPHSPVVCPSASFRGAWRDCVFWFGGRLDPEAPTVPSTVGVAHGLLPPPVTKAVMFMSGHAALSVLGAVLAACGDAGLTLVRAKRGFLSLSHAGVPPTFKARPAKDDTRTPLSDPPTPPPPSWFVFAAEAATHRLAVLRGALVGIVQDAMAVRCASDEDVVWVCPMASTAELLASGLEAEATRCPASLGWSEKAAGEMDVAVSRQRDAPLRSLALHDQTVVVAVTAHALTAQPVGLSAAANNVVQSPAVGTVVDALLTGAPASPLDALQGDLPQASRGGQHAAGFQLVGFKVLPQVPPKVANELASCAVDATHGAAIGGLAAHLQSTPVLFMVLRRCNARRVLNAVVGSGAHEAVVKEFPSSLRARFATDTKHVAILAASSPAKAASVIGDVFFPHELWRDGAYPAGLHGVLPSPAEPGAAALFGAVHTPVTTVAVVTALSVPQQRKALARSLKAWLKAGLAVRHLHLVTLTPAQTAALTGAGGEGFVDTRAVNVPSAVAVLRGPHAVAKWWSTAADLRGVLGDDIAVFAPQSYASAAELFPVLVGGVAGGDVEAVAANLPVDSGPSVCVAALSGVSRGVKRGVGPLAARMQDGLLTAALGLKLKETTCLVVAPNLADSLLAPTGATDDAAFAVPDLLDALLRDKFHLAAMALVRVSTTVMSRYTAHRGDATGGGDPSLLTPAGTTAAVCLVLALYRDNAVAHLRRVVDGDGSARPASSLATGGFGMGLAYNFGAGGAGGQSTLCSQFGPYLFPSPSIQHAAKELAFFFPSLEDGPDAVVTLDGDGDVTGRVARHAPMSSAATVAAYESNPTLSRFMGWKPPAPDVSDMRRMPDRLRGATADDGDYESKEEAL